MVYYYHRYVPISARIYASNKEKNMNKSYEYVEDEYEEGLTFKKVGHFFAKGWLRMLVYAIIAVALVSVVALPIKFFYKSEEVAQTTVEFLYEGIETGKDPDGNTLDTNNIISPSVLAKAISAAELDGVVSDVAGLRGEMRVEGVETDEYLRLVKAAADGDENAKNTLRTYVMFPTRFNIIISEPSKLGLSDAQAKLLLNKVVESYLADFKTRYSVTNMLAEETFKLSENSVMEFVDIYDSYVSKLSAIELSLKNVSADNSIVSAMTDKTSFARLEIKLSAIKTDLSNFNSFVLTHGIFRNKTSAKASLENLAEKLAKQIELQEDKIKNLSLQIENFKPNTTQNNSPSGSVITTTYPDEYYALQKQLTAAYEDKYELSNRAYDVSTRLAAIGEVSAPTPESDVNAAMEMLRGIETDTNEFVVKLSEVAEQYDSMYVSASVRQTNQPVVTRKSAGLNVIIIYAVTLIAGLLAAGVVTGVKISRANAKAKVKAQGDDEKAADKTEE